MISFRITPRPANPVQLEWVYALSEDAGETYTPPLTYHAAEHEIERLLNLLSGVEPPAELLAF